MDEPKTTVTYHPTPQSRDWQPPAKCIPCHDLELLEHLGRGGMGDVWTVEDPMQRFQHGGARGLVVKFLSTELFSRNPNMFGEFAAEARHGQEFCSVFLAPTRMFLDLSEYTGAGWPPCGLLMDRYEPSLATILQALKNDQNADGLRQELVVHIAPRSRSRTGSSP